MVQEGEGRADARTRSLKLGCQCRSQGKLGPGLSLCLSCLRRHHPACPQGQRRRPRPAPRALHQDQVSQAHPWLRNLTRGQECGGWGGWACRKDAPTQRVR